MRIILVTQNEPFYLAENLDFLFKSLSKNDSIVGVCLASNSPFGRNEPFLKKILKTLIIFGFKFFVFYIFQYFLKAFDKSKDVKATIKKYKIKIIELENSINHKKSICKISKLKPDLIFKREIINLPKIGIFNLHSSLLPKYRGLMPTFWALKNNEKYAGVSLFLVDEGIDSGPIIFQKKIEIKGYNHRELIYLTKKIGMDLIIFAIDKLNKKEKFNYLNNSDQEMTYYSFPKREDVKSFLKSGNKFF